MLEIVNIIVLDVFTLCIFVDNKCSQHYNNYVIVRLGYLHFTMAVIIKGLLDCREQNSHNPIPYINIFIFIMKGCLRYIWSG